MHTSDSYLLQETGGHLLLEQGGGALILETAQPAPDVGTKSRPNIHFGTLADLDRDDDAIAVVLALTLN